MYYVNENKGVNPHFALFSKFSIFPSDFSSIFSQKLLDLGL